MLLTWSASEIAPTAMVAMPASLRMRSAKTQLERNLEREKALAQPSAQALAQGERGLV